MRPGVLVLLGSLVVLGAVVAGCEEAGKSLDDEDLSAEVGLSSHEDTCGKLCEYKATCLKTCDYVEEPDCNEEENYQTQLQLCLEACVPGESRLEGACTSAAELLSNCLEGRSCGDGLGEACRIEEIRYLELCVAQPGTYVCYDFCTELEAGCTPYTLFGFRGPGCQEACEGSAGQLDCLEAHYELDRCTQGVAWSCGAWSGDCAPQAQQVVQLCEVWESLEADVQETEFCQTLAPVQCSCGLWEAPDCEIHAVNRCLFSLGFGVDCETSLEAFHDCMQAIESCSRDLLRDTCLPQWEATARDCGW